MVEQETRSRSTIALYYPWVTFQDEGWLKLAMLTWDNIARIRPPGMGDTDSALVRQVRDETDLILDVTPSQADLSVVSHAFDDLLYSSGIQFDFDARWDMRAVDVVFPPMPPANGGGPPAQTPGSYQVAKDGLTWVYAGHDSGGRSRGKVSGEARGILGDWGLAALDPHEGPWLGMHPKMASLYLTVLADAVAGNNHLCPVTDDPAAHEASGSLDRMVQLLFRGRTPPEPSKGLGNPENAYLHLSLNAVIKPWHLDRLPIHRITAFRQRYSAELAAFRQHVADLAPQLRAVAEVENVEVAQAHLQAVYERTTKPQLDELRRALRGLGVESAAGTLGLKVDLGAAAGTVLGAAAAAGGRLAVAGTAVTVAVLPYVAQKVRGARTLKRDSPVAYLLAVDRKLGGSSRLR